MKPIFEREQVFGLSGSFYTRNKLFSTSFWPGDSKEISSLAKLDDLYFPFPWSQKAWVDLDEVSESYALAVLRDCSSKCVAFGLWKISDLEGLAHLLKVLVIPKWRGKGLGASFLQSSLDYFIKNGLFNFYLEVEEANKSALSIYESLGFKKLHKALNFYGAGRNAVKMGKFLE